MSLCPKEKSEFEALKKEHEKSAYDAIKAYLQASAWNAIFETSMLTAIETSMGINRKELVIRALEEIIDLYKNIPVKEDN
jgi:hypothetical protein